MRKSKFIVFEGADGSGKSTLSGMLHQYLNSIDQKTYKTFEPTNGPIGSVLRNILTKRIKADEKTIGAMFLADRIDHISNETNGMLSYLDNGYHVISDRYYYSSYAYHVPHLSLDWVIDTNSVCAEMLRPDIVFYIDISVETSMERISKNRQSVDLFESKERITKVINNYKNAIEQEGHKDNVVIINGERSIEEVYADIQAKTMELIK